MHEMPCHHNLEAHLHAYIDGCGLSGDPKGPLFRTIDKRTKQISRTPVVQASAYAMVARREVAAGIATKIGNHGFRATGHHRLPEERHARERRRYGEPQLDSHHAALRSAV